MKKFNSKLLAVTAVMSIGVLATSCGKKQDSNKVEITFWHTMGQANQDTLNRMIEEFNKKYPDVVVTHEAQGGYEDLKSKISNAIPAGTTPTMAYCYPDHVASYLSSGAILQMDSYIEGEATKFTEEEGYHMEGEVKKIGKDDYVNTFWAEGTEYTEKGTYSVPFSKSTEVMFYNKTLFDQYKWSVPTTWEEMEVLMATIAATPDVGVEYALGYDSDDNLFITLCEQYGIPYTKLEVEAGHPEQHFLFNNQEAKNMVSRVKGWYDNGYLVTQGTSADGSYTSTMFTAGQLAMTIGSTGGTGYNDAKGNFEVGVAPIPGAGVTGGNNHVISQGPSICFFRRATEAQKTAAWNFYKFISNTNNSAAYSILTGYAPVRTSSFSSEIFTNYISSPAATTKDELLHTTLALNTSLQPRFFTSPAFKGSSTAREEVGGIISNVLKGTKEINKAFQDAFDACVFAA